MIKFLPSARCKDWSKSKDWFPSNQYNVDCFILNSWSLNSSRTLGLLDNHANFIHVPTPLCDYSTPFSLSPNYDTCSHTSPKHVKSLVNWKVKQLLQTDLLLIPLLYYNVLLRKYINNIKCTILTICTNLTSCLENPMDRGAW